MSYKTGIPSFCPPWSFPSLIPTAPFRLCRYRTEKWTTPSPLFPCHCPRTLKAFPRSQQVVGSFLFLISLFHSEQNPVTFPIRLDCEKEIGIASLISDYSTSKLWELNFYRTCLYKRIVWEEVMCKLFQSHVFILKGHMGLGVKEGKT